MMNVFVIANDPLTRLGVRQLIGDHDLVRECVPVERVSDLPAVPAPDTIVIVVAPVAPVMRQICARHRTLVMLSSLSSALTRAAIDAGARGIVSTGVSTTQMRIALEIVAGGGLYLCSQLSERLRDGGDVDVPRRMRRPVGGAAPERPGRGGTQCPRRAPHRPPPLAPRELETLELVVSGLTHAQTARALGVAETTVNGYITRIKAKLNAGNKAELARKAIAYGLVRWRQPVGAE